jgi:hypothetical protein
LRVGHEIAIDDTFILGRFLVQLARVDPLRLRIFYSDPYWCVLLTARATEHEREERIVTMPWLKLLAVECQIPLTWLLQRGENITCSGYKLVKTKREEASAFVVPRAIGKQ